MIRKSCIISLSNPIRPVCINSLLHRQMRVTNVEQYIVATLRGRQQSSLWNQPPSQVVVWKWLCMSAANSFWYNGNKACIFAFSMLIHHRKIIYSGIPCNLDLFGSWLSESVVDTVSHLVLICTFCHFLKAITVRNIILHPPSICTNIPIHCPASYWHLWRSTNHMEI